MSEQEAEKHNAKIENCILAITKFSTKENIDWIFQRIGGVNSKILPTEYLRIHDPSLIGGSALHISYKLDDFLIFKILLNHGGDITLKNQQEKTIIHLVLNELIPKNYTEWEGEKIKYADLILTHHIKFKIICDPCDSNGISHFHVACMSNHIEAVKFFLNNGISVDHAVDMDSPILPGYTPLHFALRFENLEVVQILLDYNADVNLKDARGMTALHVAFRGIEEDRHKSIPVITSETFVSTSLLLKYQRNYAVNPADQDGLSHFHIACCINNPVVVEEFLKHGVDVNQPINFVFGPQNVGSSPLHLVVTLTKDINLSDQIKTVMVLLKYGASLNAEDAYCNTPLHVLAKLNRPNANIFMAFIEAKADVNVRNLEGKTALEILLSKRMFMFEHTSNDEVLFDNPLEEPYPPEFENEDASYEEIERFFPTETSHRSLLYQIVPCLIENGYHLNSFNPVSQKGCLAMLSHWCDDAFMQEIILKTIQNYPGLLVDKIGRGLLHNFSSIESREEITFGRISCAKLMKEFPALNLDVNGPDNLGRTPLYMAAFFQNHQIACELLELGADVNILDGKGKTAIEYAFLTCNLCNVLCDVEHDEDEQVKHDNDEHVMILTRFVDHVSRLRYCKLHVGQRTKYLVSKIRERFREDVYELEEPFYRELDALKRTTIDPLSLPLSGFLSEIGAMAEYPYMAEDTRNAIDDYFRTQVNVERFPETIMLLNLQYRKALKRKEMIEEASDSLAVLLGFDIPYLCCRRIFRFLPNSALQNLIKAPNADENTLSN